MRREFARWALAAAVLGVGGCDQLGMGPHRAASRPPAVTPVNEAIPDFRAHAGETYADFIASPDMARYSLTAMGVGPDEQARFSHAMSNQAAGILATGGGSEALVFSGCAPSGCLEGLSVVAINVATGEAFVGVSDMAGTATLAANDRLEVLLRLTSPSQTWDDPVRPQTSPG